jgi:hypothetical protein
MVWLLVLVSAPFVLTALFMGALMGVRAATREAVERGLVHRTCPACHAQIAPSRAR